MWIFENRLYLFQFSVSYKYVFNYSKQRHNSLWRSKSETNLKSSPKPKKKSEDKLREKMPEKSESLHHLRIGNSMSSRPKSWSPNDALADILFPPQHYSCKYFFFFFNIYICIFEH